MIRCINCGAKIQGGGNILPICSNCRHYQIRVVDNFEAYLIGKPWPNQPPPAEPDRPGRTGSTWPIAGIANLV